MIHPLEDTILVLPNEQKVTRGGIVLPDGSGLGSIKSGTVVSTGPGAYQSGVRCPLSLQAGDKILYDRSRAVKVSSGGKEYNIVKPANVLAQVDDFIEVEV
jgi:co-chaperonin GroES (HSP10)